MSEIKNGKLGLYGTEHSKCNYDNTGLQRVRLSNSKTLDKD